MAAIVKSWEIDDRLVKIFEDQEIDDITLAKLDSATIKELIPIVGLRLKFVNKWTSVYGPVAGTSASKDTHNNELLPPTFDDDNETLTRQDAFLGETSFQIRTRTLNIKRILSKSLQGKAILESYRKTKILSKKCRNQIVDLILSDVLSEVNSLKNCDFEFLAKKIIDLFPNEIEAAYYVPPIPKSLSRGQMKSITSRGKLVDKYRNKIKAYRNLTGCKVSAASAAHDVCDENETDSENIEAAVKWLTKYTAPWEDVVEKWDFTREYRRKEITSTVDTKVYTIYERWPVLKHPMGYQLIERDYAALKLSTVEITVETWDTFYANVKKICPHKIDDSNAEALDELLQLEEIHEDAKVVIQLLFLSHMIPPKGRARKNKQHWKPSISECKSSMIVHAVLPGDITKIQEERTAFAKRLGLCDQPFIIAVGPNLTTFSAFHVSIDKNLYQVKSALTALNVCFEAFHALDAEYPIESQHLWLLIQKGLYKFTTKWDKSISYIEETLGMIANLNKESD